MCTLKLHSYVIKIELVFSISEKKLPPHFIYYSPLTFLPSFFLISDVQSDQSTINKVGNGSSSSSSWIILEGKDEMMNQQQQLTCCSECSTKFETEARTLKTNTTCNSDSSTSTLPAWLQKCKNENNGLTSNLDQVING